jgi:hypothetical protein
MIYLDKLHMFSLLPMLMCVCVCVCVFLLEDIPAYTPIISLYNPASYPSLLTNLLKNLPTFFLTMGT